MNEHQVYRHMVQDVLDYAIFLLDAQGHVQTWNRGAERIFGYTADEVIGKPITIIIPADRLAEEPEILARLRAGALSCSSAS